MKKIIPTPFIVLLILLSAIDVHADAEKSKKPNIMLIIADDMAFGDIEPYGSEISTPVLGQIASKGIKLSNFHATPVCSVTRGELLTGNNNIEIGLATFDDAIYPKSYKKPGYEAYLTRTTVAISEILQDAGYNTYMSGKWHLGGDKVGGWGPWEWGFDRSFGILSGGSNHWNDRAMSPDVHNPKVQAMFAKGEMPGVRKEDWYLDGKPFDRPTGIYSNDIYTKNMLDFLREGKDSNKPWFAWMAYTTAHFPIQAPRGYIEHYYPQYLEMGYAGLKKSRYKHMKKIGLINPKAAQAPDNKITDAWDSLSDSEQKKQARIMATYAAMITDQDYHIGRLLDYLSSTGELDNTLVIYLSDNGPEGMDIYSKYTGNPTMVKWFNANFDNSLDAVGSMNTENMIGLGWANAATGDLQWWKWFIGEGGIRTPMMIVPPGGFSSDYKKSGDTSNVVVSVKDIPATILDYAGIEHPTKSSKKYKNRKLVPPSGVTMKPFLEGKAKQVRTEEQWWAFELFGNAYVIQGNYKAIKVRPGMFGDGKWHLYDIVKDPAESSPLEPKHAERLSAMVSIYENYAKTHNIIEVDKDWSPFKAVSGGSH